jgi:hypothetical protein
MQDQPSDASDRDVPPTEAEDIRDQGVVLIHVLTRHPTLLMVPDLVREITAGSEEFAESDNMERAIRDLTGYGLLHCPDGMVVPTPAALRFLKIFYEGNC